MFQVKLLRVLQEGEMRPVGSQQRRRIDVRIIAATNRDLEADVRAGRFRQDLYYRLATVNIHLPPLQQRPMDIPLLAQALLEEAMQLFDKRVRGFTKEALECMQRYYWPGNVREMQNDIQRMLVLAEGDLLGADLLSPKVRLGAPPDEEQETGMLVGIEGTLKERIESLEARILRETLLRHRWNKSRAAEELGLSRVGLRSKLVRYGLERGDEPDDLNGGDLAAEAGGVH
jgi:two-component system response regulator HupR/HoxA